jgi:hypothetical protein
MSNYESNPAGIGVGKRYGGRYIGGATGVLKTDGSDVDITVILGHDELNGPLNYKLPAFCEIVGCFVAVEEAFAASSTVNFKVGSGGTAITTPVDLATAGILEVGLTGLAPTKTGATSEDLVVTPDAAALASTVGKAKLVIKARRV